jgi:KaiC/GvpD/RAD55 family RecA-like ATPase
MLKRRGEQGGAEARAERRPAPRPGPGALRIPHDAINEVVLLAAVVVDAKAAKYLDAIPADNFYGQGHAELWSALQELRRRKLDYDPATLHQLSGGRASAEQLADYVRERPVVPPNLRHHVEMLHWDRARVEAVKGPVSQFLEALRDPSADPDRVRSLALRIGDSLKGHGVSRYLRDSGAVVREHSGTLTDRREGRAIYPYGIPDLDVYSDGEHEGKARLIPGAAPGWMTVVTGLSGSGKTTSTGHMVLSFANAGRRVLYGAWEQGAGNTLELLAALSLGLSRTDVMTGQYTEEEQRELEHEMERVGQFVRFFELPFGRVANGERVYNDRNLDLIQSHIAEVGPDLFVADLFKYALQQTAPDDEELALRRMLGMTQQEKCHTILVQQLRGKDLEAREDKRPTREGVKGSGSWIEVPDTVIGWHRPALFKTVPDDKIQAIILKQRYGQWPLAVELDWEPEFGRIGAGTSIDYDRPGEVGEMDGAVGEALAAGPRRRRQL